MSQCLPDWLDIMWCETTTLMYFCTLTQTVTGWESCFLVVRPKVNACLGGMLPENLRFEMLWGEFWAILGLLSVKKHWEIFSYVVPFEHLVRVLTTDNPCIPKTYTKHQVFSCFSIFLSHALSKHMANINSSQGRPGTELPGLLSVRA